VNDAEQAGAVDAAPSREPMAVSTLLAAALLVAGAVVLLWYAPSSYSVYKALHVISIVIWVGGDITLTTLGLVFERRRDGEALAQLGKLGGWIGVHVYTPALFAVLGFGIALMEKGEWPWDVFWIDFALVGWAIAALVGVGFVGPELGRIDRTARELGPDSDEVRRRVKRLFAVFRFDTALLILIVLVMTAKPSF
jgi:uncharacterized membrane protein